MTMLELSSTNSVNQSKPVERKRTDSGEDESSALPGLEPCSDSSTATYNSDSTSCSLGGSPSISPRTITVSLTPSACSDISNSLRGNNTLANAGELLGELDSCTKKHVNFGTTEVRFYPIIAGDHPECMDGPALTLDWEPMEQVEFPINFFEESRATRADNCRRLSGLDRRRLLRSSGESDERIRASQRESHRVRMQRERTLSSLKFTKLQEAQQFIARKLRPKVEIKTKY